jgi:ADP-ribose pyrophosphatase YjhB (NUDIX family)
MIRVRVAGVIAREDKILLIAHKKKGEEYWLPPGGGIDYGESAVEALVREMKEELSIDVTVKDLVFSCDSIEPTGNRHILNLFFACESEGQPILGNDKRLSRFGYFNSEELAVIKIFPPCSRQLINYLQGKPQPIYQGSIWEEL